MVYISRFWLTGRSLDAVRVTPIGEYVRDTIRIIQEIGKFEPYDHSKGDSIMLLLILYTIDLSTFTRQGKV